MSHPADPDGVDTDALEGSEVPDGACINYNTCGNEAPGPNKICNDCLDRAREQGRGHDAGT